MPHSSGGGSSGGGYHGGSSSSSGSGSSSKRISSHPFPGAICYVYYGRNHLPHLMYTDGKPTPSMKSSIITLVVTCVFFFLPMLFLLVMGYHNPTKIKTNYDTTIVIKDNNNVLTDAEEAELLTTFNTFLDTTGIAPSLVTVKPQDTYTYDSLEDFAYREYLNLFHDEKHWLIVYSSTEGTLKDSWKFEGMQGDDTDSVLYSKNTNEFNKTLYEQLSNEYTTPCEAIINTFDKITPHIMDKTFYLETSQIVVIALFACIFTYLLVSSLLSMRRIQHFKEAVKVPTPEPELKKCIYCDSPYYAGTIDVCPHCGAHVDFPKTKPEEENEL